MHPATFFVAAPTLLAVADIANHSAPRSCLPDLLSDLELRSSGSITGNPRRPAGAVLQLCSKERGEFHLDAMFTPTSTTKRERNITRGTVLPRAGAFRWPPAYVSRKNTS